VQGWTSLIALSLIFNGIVLGILGIMGEYIGRIYEESKGRPFYVIRETAGFPPPGNGHDDIAKAARHPHPGAEV
jgi:polyisoprenyl-phosphate glycosyltransferase